MSNEDIRQREREIRRAQAQMSRLESQVRQFWLYPSGPTYQLNVLIRIGKGNLIVSYGGTPTKLYGMKYSLSSIAEIPTACVDGDNNPLTTAGVYETYTDGLCWGYTNDLGTGTPVFVANIATPSGGVAQQDIAAVTPIPENSRIYSRNIVLVPLHGSSSTLIPVYLVSTTVP